MAGRPIRRARELLQAQQAEIALRGGAERMHPVDVGYSTIIDAEPVSHIPPPRRPPRPHTPRVKREPAPVKVPALTQEEAKIFAEARQIASRKVLEFLKRDPYEKIGKEFVIADASLRHKMEMKQMEISQSVMSLSGRIDPSVMRGQQTDELGELLAAIKKQAP